MNLYACIALRDLLLFQALNMIRFFAATNAVYMPQLIENNAPIVVSIISLTDNRENTALHDAFV